MDAIRDAYASAGVTQTDLGPSSRVTQPEIGSSIRGQTWVHKEDKPRRTITYRQACGAVISGRRNRCVPRTAGLVTIELKAEKKRSKIQGRLVIAQSLPHANLLGERVQLAGET